MRYGIYHIQRLSFPIWLSFQFYKLIHVYDSAILLFNDGLYYLVILSAMDPVMLLVTI